MRTTGLEAMDRGRLEPREEIVPRSAQHRVNTLCRQDSPIINHRSETSGPTRVLDNVLFLSRCL